MENIIKDFDLQKFYKNDKFTIEFEYQNIDIVDTWLEKFPLKIFSKVAPLKKYKPSDIVSYEIYQNKEGGFEMFIPK